MKTTSRTPAQQPVTLSPRMMKARAACLLSQAHLDALGGGPAERAWAEVMDAFYELVCSTPGVSP